MRSAVLAIASKDIREYLSSRALVASVIALPLLISIAIPVFIRTLLLNVPTNLSPQVTQFLPPVLRQALLTMGPKQALYWYMFSVVTLPLFLLLPITSVIVLASDSFAGEKERRTLENLLAEPVTPLQLFFGKTLAPSSVALVVTWVSVSVYWVLASHYASMVGAAVTPGLVWVTAMLVVVPTITFANVGLVAVISSLSKGFKEAQQLSGVLILPIASVTIVSATGNLAPSVSLNLTVSMVYLGVFLCVSALWSKLTKRFPLST
ncbi:MAG: ABC transporter permease subunit [Thermoprotei archaeon]